MRLELGAGVGLEDDLGDAITVAQVDEDQAAEVAPGVDPAVQDDRIVRRGRRSIRRRYAFVSVAWENQSFQQRGRIQGTDANRAYIRGYCGPGNLRYPFDLKTVKECSIQTRRAGRVHRQGDDAWSMIEASAARVEQRF